MQLYKSFLSLYFFVLPDCYSSDSTVIAVEAGLPVQVLHLTASRNMNLHPKSL